MKNPVKAQMNCIMQKMKKMEQIQYATNNEGKSKENERKIKQNQWRNCKE